MEAGFNINYNIILHFFKFMNLLLKTIYINVSYIHYEYLKSIAKKSLRTIKSLFLHNGRIISDRKTLAN